MTASEVAGLEEIVGAERVVSDSAACAAFRVDGLAPARVVYPVSGEQVANVLRLASERGWSVIPCRNGTQLGVGNPPRRYDVALCLKNMNRVWHYEPDDLTLSAEPGMKLADLQHFLSAHGLWLPLDPPGGGRASLGGLLATNAQGPLRLHYGAPRDIVLGMKIATTQGKIVKTGGRVVKNVAGYDLGKLLIGSYGTLGVIVEASLKLFPVPAARSTFALRAVTLGVARDLRRAILASPLSPLRMVLLDAGALAMVEGDSHSQTEGVELWVEAGGSARVVERSAQVLDESARAVGASMRRVEHESAEAAWARISDFRSTFLPSGPSPTILKSSLPIAASEEFLARARQAVKERSRKIAAFAQVGVGIVHLCLPDDLAGGDAASLIETLRAAARELGGVLVVEEASPEVKRQVDVWGPTGDDFESMRKLKAAWDPKGILSPGRFVGGL